MNQKNSAVCVVLNLVLSVIAQRKNGASRVTYAKFVGIQKTSLSYADKTKNDYFELAFELFPLPFFMYMAAITTTGMIRK